MGSDISCTSFITTVIYFNPRSPHGERPLVLLSSSLHFIFQSTLPHGERLPHTSRLCDDSRISIHAPRMGSDLKHMKLRELVNISIHAPRMGSDNIVDNVFGLLLKFQSTLPAWGATGQEPVQINTGDISIHAPRMGSDWANKDTPEPTNLFQSTLPAWGATTKYEHDMRVVGFQSTLPAWGATQVSTKEIQMSLISIHAPRMGSDSLQEQMFSDNIQFQSTLPAWGATSQKDNDLLRLAFQSTLPAWGATDQPVLF